MSITTTIEYSNNTFATVKEFTITTIGTGFTITDGGGGVTDHGALTGLGDDDHTQYLNNARGDARYPTLTDYAADLLALNLELDGKFNIPSGDTTQYIAGDGSLIAFPVAGQAGTLVRQVRNETGTTLTKGTVIYLEGASGNKPLALRAIANSEAASDRTFGVVQADISNNSNGYCVVNGDLGGLNTSALTEGAILYLSDTIAGQATTTPPIAPNHVVILGIVTRSHATQGQFDVAIQNGFELDDLHDILITSVTNKDVLSYESASGVWKNKQLATSDIVGLDTALGNKQPLAVVLTNTTASFTTAQETKLSGIADGAEVNVNADWNSVSGDSQILNKPSTFTPSAHNHVIADVTGLQSALDGKQPSAVVLTNTTASFTSALETKLNGIAAGAEVNVNADWNSVSGDSQILNKPSTFTPSAHSHVISDVTGLQTALDGKQPIATVLTNTTAAFTTAQESKLAGIASGATANSSDATLLARANHTGTQSASTIIDLTESVQDIVAAQLVAGTNITLTYNDPAGTLTIDAAGGGGLTLNEIEVDFGAKPIRSKKFTITAVGVSGSSKVIVSPSGNIAAGRVGDDWEWDSISATAKAGTGQFIMSCFASGRIAGKRKFYYTYS